MPSPRGTHKAGADRGHPAAEADGVTASDRAYWEQLLTERYGPDGVGYVALGRAFNTWIYRVRKAVFLRAARPIVSAGATRVLDIGSGTGFYIDLWKRLGVPEIAGSDITETAVRRLRERHPDLPFERFDVGGVDPPPFARGSFDAVSAFDVLFHIVDDEAYRRALEAIHRLLRPRGTMLWSDNFLHGETLRAPTQVSRSLEEIRTELSRAGFEIVARRPAMVLMNAPVDSDSRALRAHWRLVSALAASGEVLGWLTGGLLYPLDMVLCRLLHEGPTTEIMVCRRR